jgi:hypothetical protein
VQWWVEFLPEVVRYVESRGFADPSADKILDAVEHHLVHHGDTFIADRWDKAPDDFFVFEHVFIEGGRYHLLKFVVKDAQAEMAVLKVVWVEHKPGNPV